MKTYETLVITEKAPGVWALQLNRPESLNALSMQMLEELADAAGMLYDLPEVRALIIIGAGNHFMAGGISVIFTVRWRSPPKPAKRNTAR
ncbi:enoyl-CoA hydratase/isomerase family protein [Hydrogenophilus thermoluteolus]|uniref:enoyl-CoA hydratase/isomerase family protein n=1 Tax=Hydrogenophilus thermoluteolus TaxID=297 RepID=UPI003F67A396